MRAPHSHARRLPAWIVAVLATTGLLLGTMSPAVFAEDKTLKDKIKDAASEYAEASKAARQAQEALKVVRQKLPAAQARLSAANKRLTTARAADRAASAALAAAIAEDRRLQVELVQMEKRIEDMSGKVNGLARRLYTSGGTFVELEIVLESQDPAEFTERLAAVDSVARSSNKMLEEMDGVRADLQLAKAKAEAHRTVVDEKRENARRLFEEANAAQDEAQKAKREVDALVEKRRKALATAEREKAKALRELNSLKAEQKRLLELARRKAGAYAGKGPSGLYWPIPGAGTSGQLGWRRHPVYGYRSCHTGLDLRAGYGTPIRSAAAGIVVDVSSGGAYGRRTLIAHGGGMTTMYAHQSRIIVREGTRVKAGQVIGYVGSTGYSTGAHLHWEVHLNGVPYDPRGWFGGSRSVISCWNRV